MVLFMAGNLFNGMFVRRVCSAVEGASVLSVGVSKRLTGGAPWDIVSNSLYAQNMRLERWGG